MAIYSGILRGMNGSAGALKFVQTAGVTVVSEKQTRVRNPKTWNQQVQRARWINAVALARVISGSRFKFAFEKAGGMVSDVNCFMQAYMAKFQAVDITPWLCKEDFDNGIIIPCPCDVSAGSLGRVTLTYNASDLGFKSEFNCSQAITSDTTIAQLSKALVGENAMLEYGDKLTYILITGRQASGTWIYRTDAVAIRLDADDNTKVMSLTTKLKSNDEEVLCVSGDANSCAAIVITRKRGDKILASNSTLSLATNADEVYHDYTGKARLAHAIEDLGGYNRTLLNPNSGSQKG